MRKISLGLILILLVLLTSGCKKSIAGKWKSIDAKNEYYYIFNKDKTCSYEMTIARTECTYEEDGHTLTILFKGIDRPKTYEYYFEGKTLVIKDDTGNGNKFVKAK